MWKRLVILICYFHLLCVRRELKSETIDDDDLDKDIDVSTHKITLLTKKDKKAEIVVEKFIETLITSEKYLRMIENVEVKLDHLETTVQDRSNSILKYLAELLRDAKGSSADMLERALQSLKKDLDRMKEALLPQVQKQQKPQYREDNAECNLEATLDSRLSFIENNMKSVTTGVEAITAVISEVKNRQQSYNLNKNINNHIGQTDTGIDVTTLLSEFRRTIQEQKARKCDCKIGRVDRSERYPTDCHEIQAQGFNITGIYKIKPEDMEPFYALCDLTSAGGGWTVIQNRFDGTQDFLKSWVEYKHGFGNLAGEFWLGLEKIYHLTNQKLYELRVEMEAKNRQEASASYSVFVIGPEHESYRISTLGNFRGSAGDSLTYHAGQKFSTYDVDNDEWKDGSCAVEHGGAWWYKECDKSNLNGKYVTSADESKDGQSIYWISFKGPNAPLYKTRMMIRPLPASRPMDYGRSRASSDNTKRQRPDGKHRKEPKSPYDTGRVRPPYRLEDSSHHEGFFPNFA